MGGRRELEGEWSTSERETSWCICWVGINQTYERLSLPRRNPFVDSEWRTMENWSEHGVFQQSRSTTVILVVEGRRERSMAGTNERRCRRDEK